jgi:hypothetical protein
MPGSVFLSCGQNSREVKIARKISALLEGPPFRLNVFIARATNNILSLNKDVLTKLAYADYFIFVNFCRKTSRFPGSLYSHQELAMALALGHEQLLIYSETGAPDMGIVKFVVQNQAKFSTVNQLLEKIRADVDKGKWNAAYSRFLRVKQLDQRPGLVFNDGAGNLMAGTGIGVVIDNQSDDLQDSVIVTLEKVDGKEPAYLFRSPLKVSGQRRYDAAIPPGSSIIFDILMDGTSRTASDAAPNPGVFLVTALDLAPLPALFTDGGDHKMLFRVDARSRKPIRFTLVRKKGEYTLS